MGTILREVGAGVLGLSIPAIIMFIIGGTLIFLAIKFGYEPTLLLPIGFGAILANIPLQTVLHIEGAGGKMEDGFLTILYHYGIVTELFPVLIFVAVGAMIDFKPLLENPFMLFFGAAAQFGIFFTLLFALSTGQFDLKEAASIGIIGAADGPTSIFVAAKFAPNYLAAISVAAYSYMSLVPLIQPPFIRMMTTKKERMMRMPYTTKKIPQVVVILFPIVITLVAGILAPQGVALIGALMFGNLLRACGVVDRLSKSAENELANLVTLLLGITIGSTMTAEAFLDWKTLMILGMGLIAFIFDTIGGVLFAKLFNLFLPQGRKVNPMIGAAGISAFPMSGRVVQKMAKKDDPTNFILMQAMSANVSGQLGSVVAGSMVLAIVPVLLLA